jgi:hypothetical protein
VLDDEFPLSMFYESLRRKLAEEAAASGRTERTGATAR